MKAVKYLFGICAGLLLLVLVEGVMTLGQAFQFEHYGPLGWIIQAIAIVFTICGSIMVVNAETNPKPTKF